MGSSSIRSHAGAGFWKEVVVLQINRIVDAHRILHQERRKVLDELEAMAGQGEFTSTPRPAPAALVRADGVAIFNQQEADCHFLLIAICHVLRTAAQQRSNPEVAEAEAAFRAAFSQAQNLRNIVEHLDEYLRGEGELQRRQTAVPLDPTVLFIRSDVDDRESEIYYHFGFHLDLPLKAAAKAAVALAEKVETVEDEKNG